MSQVIKSDFFHYENGANVTLQDLQRELVSSFNRCATRRGDEPTLHMILSKGDWKWKYEFLKQERNYMNVTNTDVGICPRCLAAKNNWLDVHERFNSARDIQAARATAVGPDIAFRQLSGWTPEVEAPDLLHVVWLGTGRDLVGSLCMEAVEHSRDFDGVTYDERFIGLRRSMQNWCIQRDIRPSTIEEITLSKLGVHTLSLDYPQGPSKGYANKVMVAYFADVLQAAWLQRKIPTSKVVLTLKNSFLSELHDHRIKASCRILLILLFGYNRFVHGRSTQWGRYVMRPMCGLQKSREGGCWWRLGDFT